MSRQLKFRAYNNKSNKWEFGYEYPSLGGFSLTGEVVLCGELSSIPMDDLYDNVVFDQFVGMFDIHGKEIYENDIVNGLSFNGSYKYGKVVYYQYGFTIIPIGKFSEGFSDDFERCEIIGNIHENKDLLL